jgi:4-hydroxyphenylpyruvate dioxygenase-like putative hemolysin
VGALEFEYIQPLEEPYLSMLFGMPSGGAGINHVAWKVSDVHAALDALREIGIQPGHVTPDGVIDIGRKRMVYLDPETTGGLVIELIQLLDEADGA